MKKISFALVLAAVVTLAAGSRAAAQSSPVATVVKVPFQFIVGDSVLPAGSYRISPQAADWSVVFITNLNGAPAALVATEGLASSEPTPKDDSKVSFTRYAGHYFLQAVAVPGRDGRQVRITRAEAERTLAKLNLLGTQPANSAK